MSKKKSGGVKPKKATSKKSNGKRPGEERIEIGEAYEEKLPVPISAEESRVAGEQIAATIRERANWLERRKADNAKAREERAYYDQRIAELGEAIEKKTRQERIKCQDVLVKRGGKHIVEIIRKDTGEVVMTREPKPAELQQTMFESDAQDNPAKLAPAPGALRGPGEGPSEPDEGEGGIGAPDVE